ncbi:MAG: CSLREA domain-containing protein, partial [bacterium]|nr:CSLREA domain-containing protein [bacterium]
MNNAPQIVTLVSLILLSGAPAPPVDAAEPVIETAAVNRAIEVQDRHQEELFEKPGVIGVGVTYRGDQVALLVLVEEGGPRPELAASIEAIPLVVEESAPIVPLNGGEGCAGTGGAGQGCHVGAVSSLPIPMGVNAGPPCPATGGTPGFVACHPASRTRGYVTCNHVAAFDDGCPNGDPGIVQFYQSPFDVSCSEDAVIGTLSDLVTIRYQPYPYNLVDAAFVVSSESQTSPYILDLGYLDVVPTSPILGRCVAKSGRTTGLTYGRINGIHVTNVVNYGCGSANFIDTVRIEPDDTCGQCENPPCDSFGMPGDSGSAVVDISNHRLVGVLFSGPGTGAGYANTAPDVLNALEVSLDLTLCDPPTITVVQPGDGDIWATGTTEDILWSSTNPTTVGDVRIELSRDGGGWETLFPETDNDGIESWPVTGPGTAAARVRISSVADPAISATSDWFAIAGVSVLEPTGGEAWLLGEHETIRWTGDGVPGEVAIELWRDGGGWEDIGLAPTPNDGIQEWLVTGGEAGEALIRVRSVELGSVSATSDDYFTISANLVVDSTGDGTDDDLSDGICRAGGGYCTLRAAIEQANAMPGLQNVSFELPGSGVPTIAPNSPLPAISDPIV